MEDEKILIPRIEEKIERKLKELNLKPEVPIKEFLKIHGFGRHRYFSPCQRGKETLAFYARLHDNLDAKEKFIREIEFLKKIKENSIGIKDLIPEIFNFGLEEDFEWLVREYPKAPPLGSSRNLKQKISLKIIENLTSIIFEISKISLKIKLKKFDYKNYFPERTYLDLIKKRVLSEKLVKKMENLIQKNFPLLKKEDHYFSHGDLNLGNILSNGKRVWIIDWELIHLNNFAYDIGYLWAHLWEAKRDLRRKLIKSYLKKLNNIQLVKFKQLFPVVVSYFSLGGIYYKKEKERLETQKRRRKFYLQLLENCPEKFENLINI
jgi:thiamine kinase-like enzyme